MDKVARGVDAELVVHEFLDFLDHKYGVSRDELNKLVSREQKKEPLIPVEIFANRALGPMEAVVKFLRENRGLAYSQISELTGRSRSTIGVMYHSASQKLSKPFPDFPPNDYSLPLSELASPRYTALEAIVMFLVGKRLRICQVAELLNRDYRTAYTIYRRGRRKNEA